MKVYVLNSNDKKTKKRINLCDYYNKLDLYNMGFNDRMITTLLTSPVRVRAHELPGRPIKLYWEKTAVTEAMTSEIFLKRQELKNDLKNNLSNEQDEKIKLLDQINNIKIRVRKIPDDLLYQRAIDSKRKYEESKGKLFSIENLRDDIAKRWIDNYIRHNLTTYDNVWKNFFQKQGSEELHNIFLLRVESEILKVYPHYTPRLRKTSIR